MSDELIPFPYRDEDGVCTRCGVGAELMHEPHCPTWTARIDLPPSHEMGKATGGAVRGWDFGLVGERPNPFPALRFTAGEELKAGELIVQREDGKCYKAAPGESGAFPFTPGGVGYAAIRIKASEPLACYACGTLDGHDENCPVGFLVNLLTGGTATLHIPARPSTISKLLARRRKLIAKAKRRPSNDDAAVGSAILAMSGKGRANEL